MAQRLFQRVKNTLPVKLQMIDNKQKAALFVRWYIIPKIKNWQYGQPIRRIGNPSVFGSVYITDKGYAIKLQNDNKTAATELETHRSMWGNNQLRPFIPEPFKNYSVPVTNSEAKKMVQYKAANTPPTTGKISVLAMNLLNVQKGWMSLGDYVSKYSSVATKNQKNKAMRIYRELHQLFSRRGYPHQNGHTFNIMVKVDPATGNIIEYKFIDFGSVETLLAAKHGEQIGQMGLRSGRILTNGRRTGEEARFMRMQVPNINPNASYRFNKAGAGRHLTNTYIKNAKKLWRKMI